ncbi:hypothetical protein [Aquimarina longa]|uniref:hypothetical protein n=1 Tax=Aquimarina longa TaxID=1080221 RepID=UPI000781DEDD|nr:hypothetical protein [Aquimarina longa]
MLSKKIVLIFFLILTVFSFAQCKTIEKGDKRNEKSTTHMINNSTSVLKLNRDKTMELSIRKNMVLGDPAIYFEYVVYTKKTREVIKKGSFRGTDIDWYDNESLKLTSYVGIEQKPTSENPEDALLINNQNSITIIKLNN